MSTDQYEVVVYGASGYTGKLIAWKLATAGIPFIAAGRDQARLVAHYIAGMTDRYAIREHRRIFSVHEGGN